MSHFSTILKNLVASGMTNTDAALVVLESFFEKNDKDACDRVLQYRGNIADTKSRVELGTISEEDAQLAFAKAKAGALDLISIVDNMAFEDAVVVNYFAMLTPNPAKDPFFSPIEPEEQSVKTVAQSTPSTTESPKKNTESENSSWALIIGSIGLLLLIGLVYLIVAFGTCTTSPKPNALTATAQPTDPVKPTDGNKAIAAPAVKPATTTISATTSATKTTTSTTTATLSTTTSAAKPLPEKPKVPEIKVKSAAAREKIELIVDSLTVANNRVKLQKDELKKSDARLIELAKLSDKNPDKVAKTADEEKKFNALRDEIKALEKTIERLKKSLPK